MLVDLLVKGIKVKKTYVAISMMSLQNLQNFSEIVQMLNALSEVLFLDRRWLRGFLEFSTVAQSLGLSNLDLYFIDLNLLITYVLGLKEIQSIICSWNGFSECLGHIFTRCKTSDISFMDSLIHLFR